MEHCAVLLTNVLLAGCSTGPRRRTPREGDHVLEGLVKWVKIGTCFYAKKGLSGRIGKYFLVPT